MTTLKETIDRFNAIWSESPISPPSLYDGHMKAINLLAAIIEQQREALEIYIEMSGPFALAEKALAASNLDQPFGEVEAIEPALPSEISVKLIEDMLLQYASLNYECGFTDAMKERVTQRTLDDRQDAKNFIIANIRALATKPKPVLDVEALDMAGYKRGFQDCEKMIKDEPWRFSKDQPVDSGTLVYDVEEYLHWRKVNPQIKGGENYLKRFRQSLAVAPKREVEQPHSLDANDMAVVVYNADALDYSSHDAKCLGIAKSIIEYIADISPKRESGNRWKPIDDKAKNGDRIILGVLEDGEVVNIMDDFWYQDRVMGGFDNYAEAYDSEPTHYMPLITDIEGESTCK